MASGLIVTSLCSRQCAVLILLSSKGPILLTGERLYITGTQVYAVRTTSPLHPNEKVKEGLIPVTLELRGLALSVGELFGLDICGVDVVQTAEGWVGVDINDFPGFGGVPGAVDLMATSILHVGGCAAMQCSAHARRPRRRHELTSAARAGWQMRSRACRPSSRLATAYRCQRGQHERAGS